MGPDAAAATISPHRSVIMASDKATSSTATAPSAVRPSRYYDLFMVVKGKRKARVILTLAGYAMAGLVTTLGIAWAQPVAGSVRTFVTTGKDGEQELISTRTSDRYVRFVRAYTAPEFFADPANATSFAEESRSAKYCNLGRGQGVVFSVPVDALVADFRGFPFRCSWAWEWADFQTANGWIRKHSYLEIPLFVDPRSRRGILLPVTPVWPGLITDTAIWGFAWYALLFVPFRLLSWSAASRTRRGLCIACGYDLTGAWRRCPECGEEISMGGTKATIAK